MLFSNVRPFLPLLPPLLSTMRIYMYFALSPFLFCLIFFPFSQISTDRMQSITSFVIHKTQFHKLYAFFRWLYIRVCVCMCDVVSIPRMNSILVVHLYVLKLVSVCIHIFNCIGRKTHTPTLYHIRQWNERMKEWMKNTQTL